jgi:hypothetical protein
MTDQIQISREVIDRTSVAYWERDEGVFIHVDVPALYVTVHPETGITGLSLTPATFTDLMVAGMAADSHAREYEDEAMVESLVRADA